VPITTACWRAANGCLPALTRWPNWAAISSPCQPGPRLRGDKPGRPAHKAVLALKACVVTLKRPMRNRAAEAAKLLPRLDLWFVEAREINPPPGVPPLHWRLLTTHAVTSLADAKRVSGHHAQRWTIEQLFRVMKTKGFDVEAVRMADVVAFESLAAAILIAAVQMPQMVSDRDGINKRPPEDVFEPSGQPALEVICQTLEGKTAKQKNPPQRQLGLRLLGLRPPPAFAGACWAAGPDTTESQAPES
jgi:hypothetical protein